MMNLVVSYLKLKIKKNLSSKRSVAPLSHFFSYIAILSIRVILLTETYPIEKFQQLLNI